MNENFSTVSICGIVTDMHGYSLLRVLLGIGLLISAYLLIAKTNESALVCGFSNCGTVNTSVYADIFGIPIALLGVVFYCGMLALSFLRCSKCLIIGAFLGVMGSLYFTYLEAFVIHAWCEWCVLSAWITVAVCVVVLRLRKMER